MNQTQAPFAIGFVGAGQLAMALAKGWLAAGLLDRARSRASAPSAASRDRFHQETGITVTAKNAEVISSTDLIVLAIKPQTMKTVLADIRSHLTGEHRIISLAAGISLKQLSEGLEANYRTIRVMPNTPSLVGACAAGFSASTTATAADIALVETLFNAVGRAFPLPEKCLDAVTGLSGSGPAYIYVLIEALSDGGVRMGLPRDVATALAAQTVMGAAKMVLETGRHPAVLKDAVTSPGGTTIAGIHALERGGFRAAVIDAVEAATLRSAELGKGS